ncbi:MAG: phosphate ABC transporter ATP-binding protein [Candidatus Cloacimonetes bacterium]|nr:phosphate ABC transporter ATP-binding protein [Candidatus Cloacimonadota bacterium]MBS3767339.1 phosphate ABC transporter ATP-binding protein [Candidatus Cloacimonadota bacterium]
MVKKSSNVRTKDLNLWFGEKHVLKNMNIEIPEKTITAIMGPSGCGKSTFLRCLNRMNDLILEAKIKGSILIDNKDIYNSKTDITALRKKVGMVFQRPNPFPKSIFDNIAYGLKINQVKKNRIPGIVEQSLKATALWNEVKDRLHDSAMSLSGGQQQRLCIARAIAVEPEVVLMDEPASALDPSSTLKIEELMKKLKNKYTIILVTHNMQQAARVSDYTAFFYVGELIEFGKTEQVFQNPDEKLTESYISGKFG